MCYLIGNVFQVSDVVSGSPRNSYSIHIIGCKVTDTSGPRATLFILAPIKGIDKLQKNYHYSYGRNQTQQIQKFKGHSLHQ